MYIIFPVKNRAKVLRCNLALCLFFNLFLNFNLASFAKEDFVNSPISQQKPINSANSEPAELTEEFNFDNAKDINAKNEHIIPVLDLKGEVEVIKDSAFQSWLKQDKMTGDWKGIRGGLEENGISISGSYMTGVFGKYRGGTVKKNVYRYNGLLSTGIELDTEKMHLIKGGKAFINFNNVHGSGLTNKYVGDYMFFDGADPGRPLTQVTEYWYEQSLLKDKLKIKLGKQDANNDFMALDTGFKFIHSGFSFMPNIPISTYPETGLGAAITVSPTPNTYLKYGWFDGKPNGKTIGLRQITDNDGAFMNITEVGFTHNHKNHPGKALVCLWNNTGDMDEIVMEDVQGRAFDNNYGIYTAFEQLLYKEKPDDNKDIQGLSLIGQFGWSPSDRNEMTKYFGVATAYRGLFPKRDNDLVGIGGAFASFSRRLHKHPENVLELFYKCQICEWFSIQPDFQYINKPFDADRSAIVFGVRTNIDF